MPIPLALGLISGARGPSFREQGTVVQEEPVLLSFCPHWPLQVQPSISDYRKRCRLIGSIQQGLWSRDQSPHFSPADRKSSGEGKVKRDVPFQFLLSYSPWDPWVPPHGTSPKVSWCVWLVGNPVCEPCTSGPHSRAPKKPGGPSDKGCLESGPPATASFLSLCHQSPTQGSLPGLGHQPLVREVPQRLVTSCICPSPSGPGPSRPGAAK